MRKSVFSFYVVVVLCSLCCFPAKGSSSYDPTTSRVTQRVVNTRAVKGTGQPLGRCTHYGPLLTDKPEEETNEEGQQRAQAWLDGVVVGSVDDAFWPRPERLRHISGIVASPAYADRDVYWVVQNVAVSLVDEILSGGRHRHYETDTLHAITRDGRILGTASSTTMGVPWNPPWHCASCRDMCTMRRSG